MAVVHFQPDLNEGNLASGFNIERGTSLRSLIEKEQQTSCEYRTAHSICLWPLELTQAEYSTYSGGVSGVSFKCIANVRSTLRLRLKCTGGFRCDQILIDQLPLYLRGSDGLPGRMLEQLLSHSLAIVGVPCTQADTWSNIIAKTAKSINSHTLETSPVGRIGFDEDQALLPNSPRAFQGYRLLHEYFAFPERFMFAKLCGLQIAMQACTENEIDLFILFDQVDQSLEQIISADNFPCFVHR